MFVHTTTHSPQPFNRPAGFGSDRLRVRVRVRVAVGWSSVYGGVQRSGPTTCSRAVPTSPEGLRLASLRDWLAGRRTEAALRGGSGGGVGCCWRCRSSRSLAGGGPSPSVPPPSSCPPAGRRSALPHPTLPLPAWACGLRAAGTPHASHPSPGPTRPTASRAPAAVPRTESTPIVLAFLLLLLLFSVSRPSYVTLTK